MSPILANWQTSLGGLGMIAGGVGALLTLLGSLLQGHPPTGDDGQAALVALAAIAGGVGMLRARDAKGEGE